jgi:hypothetical protein
MKKEINKAFNDLDAFRRFCVQFGRRFNEMDLYKHNSENYKDFLNYRNPNSTIKIPNHWRRDDKQWGFNKWNPGNHDKNMAKARENGFRGLDDIARAG